MKVRSKNGQPRNPSTQILQPDNSSMIHGTLPIMRRHPLNQFSREVACSPINFFFIKARICSNRSSPSIVVPNNYTPTPHNAPRTKFYADDVDALSRFLMLSRDTLHGDNKILNGLLVLHLLARLAVHEIVETGAVL